MKIRNKRCILKKFISTTQLLVCDVLKSLKQVDIGLLEKFNEIQSCLYATVLIVKDINQVLVVLRVFHVVAHRLQLLKLCRVRPCSSWGFLV